MPGLFGGTVGPDELRTMADETYAGDVHETARFALDGRALGLTHHGDVDPGGHTVVDEADVLGLVYGALTRVPTDDPADLVRGVLESPQEVLPRIDGPFLLVVADRTSDRLLVATDKRGTRACYYAEPDASGLVFGSELTALVPFLDDPSLDVRAVADMLSMLCVWGERTLLETVRALRPASYLWYDGGEVSVESYWTPTFDERTDDGYVPDLVDTYTEAIEATLDTVEGAPGLWLSGGLDSRTMAAGMCKARDDLVTYTYRRPMGYDSAHFATDRTLAERVATALSVPNEPLEITPESLHERLDELVRLTDGMVAWRPLANVSAVFELDPSAVDAVFEASDPLIGAHVTQDALSGVSHPADALHEMHARHPDGLVKALLTPEVEPKDTFFEEAVRCRRETRAETILHATNTNYYFKNHYLGNKVARARVGTRMPLTTERVLRVMNQVPRSGRRRRVPFTAALGTPVLSVPAPMKLQLLRALDTDLSKIKYEATQLPPTAPHALHTAAFLCKETIDRVGTQPTGTRWLQSDETLRRYVDDLLLGAADRDLFDASTIHRLRHEQFHEGTDRTPIISAITTVELFVRMVLDD
ncbi:asparagine synthase-related protein [Salinigranum halophilum]|jgi:asparagine synthase (glutamine-hydrolysing)|uniref:asparagine synthase-related protein n=1 Tax=Salinigranum halophilum TaxID=2565931 RepID=UPI0010A7CFCD|nr:asparagine synthase-related protein [Salinigranum halophilum]